VRFYEALVIEDFSRGAAFFPATMDLCWINLFGIEGIVIKYIASIGTGIIRAFWSYGYRFLSSSGSDSAGVTGTSSLFG